MTYYESEWGYCITLYSLWASMKAANDKKWNKHAIISSEIAMCFNLAIMPIFWILLAPTFMPTLDWHGIQLFFRFEMTIVHILPFMVSVLNLMFTKMVFLHKDSKYCFLAAVGYMVFNFVGLNREGHPMYPVIDWYNLPQTIAIFMFQAVMFWIINHGAASAL